MKLNGHDLNLLEFLQLIDRDASDMVFKNGEISIPGVIAGIKKFSYNETLKDSNNPTHKYSLVIDYSKTDYMEAETAGIGDFDVFIEETKNGLKASSRLKRPSLKLKV